MQLSITAFVVLMLALGTSYFMTRPIGDGRRHVAAGALGLSIGILAGFVTNDMVFYVSVALIAAAAGMVLAWRARNSAAQPEANKGPGRRYSKKKSHYHGLTKA